MTINEAKMQIAKEFISKYTEWLADYNSQELTDRDYGWKYGWCRGEKEMKDSQELTDRDYGWKYGWCRGEKEMKDTQKSMLWFQSHIYSGRYLRGWKEAGIDPAVVYELHRAGFFSYDYCYSHQARMLGKTDFYYINQNKAKEIYKAYKNGFFAA